MKHLPIKLLSITVLILIIVFLTIFGVRSYQRTDPQVREQVEALVKHLPGALLSYPFKAKTSGAVEIAKAKTGGFIKGICHPNDEYEQIKGAGIEWDRADIPFPFDENGNIRQSYVQWKERMGRFVENGIRIMAVTPYPRDYIEFGVDPRLPGNEDRVKEIAVFLIHDLQGLIGAMQISNELYAPRFKYPMTSEEVINFIRMNLEAVYPIRGNVLVGYNTAGPQMDQHAALKPYLKYCDYVGVDIYIGCFFELGNWMWFYDMTLNALWSYTGKPIILCEFGYISGGAPKTVAEKKAILEQYGASSEKEARSNITAFVGNMPEKMRYNISREASGDLGDFVFNSEFTNHLYMELPEKVVVEGYPHTPEGQALFYTDIFPRLVKKDYLIGTFVYCYSDSSACYYCGQPDCPIETRWGLVTVDGHEKPSYYAVRDMWAETK
jgi:hypothetical protein